MDFSISNTELSDRKFILYPPAANSAAAGAARQHTSGQRRARAAPPQGPALSRGYSTPYPRLRFILCTKIPKKSIAKSEKKQIFWNVKSSCPRRRQRVLSAFAKFSRLDKIGSFPKKSRFPGRRPFRRRQGTIPLPLSSRFPPHDFLFI